MSLNFGFRGLMAPVFTPFDRLGKLNLDCIEEYANYLYSNDIRGILVNGTTGEGVSLTTEERKSVLRAWINASKPYGQTIMVQVGGTNVEDVKLLAADAEGNRVSAILCLGDLFFKATTVDECIHYLKIVSRAAPKTPLLYYHIPGFTGINVDVKELLLRRREVPTLVGIKFTDNDLVVGTSCLSGYSSETAVFLGCDKLLLPALVQGFDSAIGTSINMFPSHNNLIVKFFKEGNLEKAAKEQRELNFKIEEITKLGSWVSSMKAAMRRLTAIDVGPVRDPLINVNPEAVQLYGGMRSLGH